MNKLIIFIVSFFIFPGYYAGLSLFYFFQIQDLSRFYTVPLRVFLLIIMVYFILKNSSEKKFDSINSLVLFFSLLYIIKIFYTELDLGWQVPLSRPWYEFIFYFFSFNILPFLFFSSINLKEYGKLIIESIIASGFVFGSVIIIIYKDVLLSGGIGRISDLYYYSGDETINPLSLSYSGALVFALIFYQFNFLNNKLIKKIYLIITLLISFVLIFMGASRGAIVAVILSLLLIILYTKGKGKVYLILSLIFLIPIIIYIMEFTGSNLFGRVSETIDSGDTSGRDVLWNEALDVFYKYPFLGGRIEVSGIYPHNIFIELLMATGFVGFVVYIIIILKTFRNGIYLSKIHSIYLIGLIILANGISQYLFSGAIWQSLLIFAPLGMLNLKIDKKMKN